MYITIRLYVYIHVYMYVCKVIYTYIYKVIYIHIMSAILRALCFLVMSKCKISDQCGFIYSPY